MILFLKFMHIQSSHAIKRNLNILQLIAGSIFFHWWSIEFHIWNGYISFRVKYWPLAVISRIEQRDAGPQPEGGRRGRRKGSGTDADAVWKRRAQSNVQDDAGVSQLRGTRLFWRIGFTYPLLNYIFVGFWSFFFSSKTVSGPIFCILIGMDDCSWFLCLNWMPMA